MDNKNLHSFEMYASILNYFLSPRKDEEGNILNPTKQPALKVLPLLDVHTLEQVKTFGSKAVVKILQLIKRYYDQYKTIPSKIIYEDLKENDAAFKKWFVSEATEDQRKEVGRLDLYLFQPVQDETYLEEMIVDLSVKIELQKMIQNASRKLNEPGAKGIEALENLHQSSFSFKEKYELTRSKRVSQHRYVYHTEKKAEDYQRISGIGTQFNLLELRPNGLLGLFGGPKDGKTRAVISVARYLAAKGYDVEFMDLENGDKELEARILQADLSDWKGYPVKMAYFYAGMFIHEDRIPYPKYSEDGGISIAKDMVYYTVGEWTEIETDENGKEREQMYVNVQLFKALVHAPTLNPVDDTKDGNIGHEWEFMGVYEEDTDSLLVYESFQSVLNEAMKEISEKRQGQIRIDYIPSASISEVHQTITNVIEDPFTDFFSRPGWRILILDWVQLLQNKKYNDIWQRTRENYATLKSWQGLYQMYILVVDGVKDTSQLEKLYPDLKKAGTVGTSQTDYNVASSVLFCVSPEEKRTRTARLVSKVARYGGSGANIQEFLRIDEEYATITVITKEEHQRLNPELWDESKPEKKNKKKEKGLFDGIELN